MSLGFPRQPYVTFGPFKTPGVAKVRAPNSPRNWNVQQGWGLSGAVAIYTGAGLAKFVVDVFLWEATQFLEWQIFAKGALEKPKPGLGVGSAMGIGHPVLNMSPWSIQSIVVEDVDGFEQSPTGLWACAIHCLEYRKPIPAVARPIAAIPAATIPQPTAQSAQEAAMLEVAQQIALEKAKL